MVLVRRCGVTSLLRGAIAVGLLAVAARAFGDAPNGARQPADPED